MNEQQKENKQTADESKKIDNFFIQELRERAKIKHELKLFKIMVDADRERKLRIIESDIKHRQEDISADISVLESALNGDNAEQIKEALKKLKL